MDPYTPAAQRLWRWTDATQDAQITTLLAGRVNPATLTLDDLYQLITFVRRSALAALRTRSDTHLTYGFAALALLDLERVDWRDAAWAAALLTWSAQRLDTDPSALAALAVKDADPETAELITHAAAESVDLSGDWGYRAWPTADGLVLLDTEDEPYAPDADLVARLLSLCEALAADGYEVEEVTVACELPSVWVGERDRLVRGLAGCACLDTDGLLVYLAETRTPAQASAIAAAADAYGGAHLATSKNLLAMIAITQPDRDVPTPHRLRAMMEAFDTERR
ncbi:hypothetical protein OIE66_08035 [Nonomuraea sp. NBC_01738]|uniref:hypothetical protein n=1 Tax=Nonomuraea sp. NBC_01738 TaxID=2976003 RepID=UPI002E0E483F|nr:hypothetical protein OIE66_08035 [Nonomuraea sp. NBC_01738]